MRRHIWKSAIVAGAIFGTIWSLIQLASKRQWSWLDVVGGIVFAIFWVLAGMMRGN